MPSSLITLIDLHDAARTIAGVVVRTPLLPADELTDRVGAPVWLKPETLQRGGAFKLRGAYNFLAKMSAEERSRGVSAPVEGFISRT